MRSGGRGEVWTGQRLRTDWVDFADAEVQRVSVNATPLQRALEPTKPFVLMSRNVTSILEVRNDFFPGDHIYPTLTDSYGIAVGDGNDRGRTDSREAEEGINKPPIAHHCAGC